MPQPVHIEGCLLQRTLGKWAACFTPHKALQLKLIEDTITEILENLSSQDDEFEIDVEMFAAMRRAALHEFGMAKLLPSNERPRGNLSRSEQHSMKRE
ncbi:hypothetical protein [Agrobacterium pusense]|uniref:hypothetical protein n=1 Tax=Agrobacterium pusense TaxID=648995 RepID=UPI003FD37800